MRGRGKSARYLRTGLFIVAPVLLGTISLITSHLDRGKWWMELLSFTMPVVLVGLILVLLAWLLWRPGLRHLWPTLLAMAIAAEPMGATFAFRPPRARQGHDLSVMSFNAALFNPYRPSTLESDPDGFTTFYDHLRNNPSPDILCIQEFFHSNRAGLEMAADSIQRLGGYSYFYTNPVYDDKYDGLIGVITFSKYPAEGRGKLEFGDHRSNNGHWNDFVIGQDTVRVYNIQLRSMSIRWDTRDSSSAWRNTVLNLRHIHQRLKWGYRMRNREMDQIEQVLDNSPHRSIVCADLNALPYSHTYQRLKSRYHTAFEKGGSGFGFTYHHFPWFIRIDNQFFDHRMGIRYFSTLKHINISDHYPIEAGYVLDAGR